MTTYPILPIQIDPATSPPAQWTSSCCADDPSGRMPASAPSSLLTMEFEGLGVGFCDFWEIRTNQSRPTLHPDAESHPGHRQD